MDMKYRSELHAIEVLTESHNKLLQNKSVSEYDIIELRKTIQELSKVIAAKALMAALPEAV